MSSRKQQDSCTDEFRAIVTECTTPEKTQARPNLSTVGEATYAVVEELLEIYSRWKRESACFNNVVPGKSTMLCLMESNTFKNTWPTQTGFEWLKKRQSWVNRDRVDQRGVRGGLNKIRTQWTNNKKQQSKIIFTGIQLASFQRWSCSSTYEWTNVNHYINELHGRNHMRILIDTKMPSHKTSCSLIQALQKVGIEGYITTEQRFHIANL